MISHFSSTKFPVNTRPLWSLFSVSRDGCLRRGNPNSVSRLKEPTVGIQRQTHSNIYKMTVIWKREINQTVISTGLFLCVWEYMNEITIWGQISLWALATDTGASLMDLSYERMPFGKAQQFTEMLSSHVSNRGGVDFVSFCDFLEDVSIVCSQNKWTPVISNSTVPCRVLSSWTKAFTMSGSLTSVHTTAPPPRIKSITIHLLISARLQIVLSASSLSVISYSVSPCPMWLHGCSWFLCKLYSHLYKLTCSM